MSTDTKVTELVFNELTEEKLKELENAGTVPPNEIFFTDDDETSPRGLPLGTIIPAAVISDDASLHLLDGSSLIQNGIYKQFCDWLKARVLANSGNVPTCTIAEYANEMTTYGQCGKFVINDTSSVQTSNGYRVEANSIKLPTITEFIASNNGGDSIGLAELDMFKHHIHELGAPEGFWAYGVNSNMIGNGLTEGGWAYRISNNFVLANGGEETRPKNVRYPYYIVVASSVKTDVEVDIDNVTSDINEINSTLNKTEQVETIYDMYDSTKDWGYSGGIQTGTTVTGKDFSKYKRLRVWGRFGTATIYPALINMEHTRSGNKYSGYNIVGYGYESSSTRYLLEVGGEVNGEKTSFTARYGLTNLPDGREVGSDSDKRIIKIEGVY